MVQHLLSGREMKIYMTIEAFLVSFKKFFLALPVTTSSGMLPEVL